MASSRDFLDFILEQLSGLGDVEYRAMMGEYIIYYRGRIVGGIYDDRFLVKPTQSAQAMMPDALRELPREYNDHSLTGEWRGFRECHIKPDWLMIYAINNGVLTLTLSKTGSHSDLF